MSTEPLQVRQQHQANEDGAQACHHMECVIEQLDVGWPRVFGECIQATNVGVKRPVREEAEHPGHSDRVIETPFAHIRLSDQCDIRARAGLESSLHCGERGLLMTGDDLGLSITGRKCHEDRSNQTDGRAMPQVHACLLDVVTAKRIERAYGCDDESPSHERCRLVMRELYQRPLVQQIRG
jgi:hypothetical protein